MSVQLTTIISSYKSLPDQTKPCRLTNVPKSLNGERFQCYCEYWRILSSRPGGFLKLSQIIRQSSWRTIMCGQRIHQSYSRRSPGCRNQQSHIQGTPLLMSEQLQCRGPSSHPFESTMVSNTCRYCSQLVVPANLGTLVDVNVTCLEGGKCPKISGLGPHVIQIPLQVGYCIHQHVLRGPGKIPTVLDNILVPSFSKNVRS